MRLDVVDASSQFIVANWRAGMLAIHIDNRTQKLKFRRSEIPEFSSNPVDGRFVCVQEVCFKRLDFIAR